MSTGPPYHQEPSAGLQGDLSIIRAPPLRFQMQEPPAAGSGVGKHPLSQRVQWVPKAEDYSRVLRYIRIYPII